MARRLTLDFARGDALAVGAVALAAGAGLALAHSPWRGGAAAWLTQAAPVRLGGWGETLSLLLWTRDALMTLFFFGLGLELKTELTRGELSSPRRLALPVSVALCGLAAATGTYAVAGFNGRSAWSHWPAVLGVDVTLVIAAIGPAGRASSTLRSFALAVALTDNFALVLALACRSRVDAEPLAVAAAALCFLALLSRWRAAPLTLFAGGFAIMWAATLRAGLDPSAAGVAAAFMLPLRPRRTGERGLVERARHALRPLLAYGVTPLFVFCALGPVATAGPRPVDTHVAAVVVTALLLKAIGSAGVCALAARLGWARRPGGLSWRELSIVGFASGAGLTCNLYGLGARGSPGADASGAGAAVAATSLVVFAATAWAFREGVRRPPRTG